MRISVYKELNDRIPIDKATGGEIDPILWCRDGEFRIIPTSVIKNAMDLHESFRHTNLKCRPPRLYFCWSQGIPINNAAGRVLVGE